MKSLLTILLLCLAMAGKGQTKYDTVKVAHRYFMYSYITSAGGNIHHYGQNYLRDVQYLPTYKELQGYVKDVLPDAKNEHITIMSLYEFKSKKEYNRFDPEKAFAK